MKKLLFFIAVLSNIYLINSQKVTTFCGSDEIHQNQLLRNSNYYENFTNNKAKWQSYALERSSGNKTISPFTDVVLPIAIHDISSSGSYLISSGTSIDDYQYVIDALNNVYDIEQGTGISFCLAKKDSQGNMYEFDETQSSDSNAFDLDRTDITQKNHIVSTANPMRRFNTHGYINIYIVDSIEGTVAGFATLPSSHGTYRDGIFIERAWLDTTSLNNDIKVLVHEMGHYLGLFHTFQYTFLHDYGCDTNDNCLNDGDMVCDTPPHLNPLETTPVGGCFSTNTCNLGVPTITDGTHLATATFDPEDPIHNFMNYTPQSCQNEFTNGQIERMHFMVNSIDGPRKSLLETENVCTECANFDDCDFEIEPSINLEAPRHYITEGDSVQFTGNNDCGYTNLTYTFTLTNITTNTTEFTNSTTANINNLTVGNYLLVMTATDNANSDCVEIVEYNFTIIPQMVGGCTLVTDWSDWSRISYNANIAGNHNWINPDTQTPITDNDGFEVIPLSSGDQIPNDPNFTGITLPADANITNVIRVGRQYDGIDGALGGGRAHYVQKTFQVTPDNCRFKVWYLGGTHGRVDHIANLFYTTQTNNDAAFGWLCEYKYNSEVLTVGSDISTIGSSYNSGANQGAAYNVYDQNDMVSLSLHSNTSYFDGENFNKMTSWRSQILDFSDFVLLDNPTTEITITFFEHSNDIANATQNAYSYFGVECLGGGYPQEVSFEAPDISIPCSNSSLLNSLSVSLRTQPLLNYLGHGWKSYKDINYAFRNVELFMVAANGNEIPYSFTLQSGQIVFSIDPNSVGNKNFIEFRIVYHTLNETVEDNFFVYFGFNNSEDLCTSSFYDYDFNDNGTIDFNDFDRNGDGVIDDNDFSAFDTDNDGILDDTIDYFTFDTNSDGVIDIDDFDTNNDGIINNDDNPQPYPSDSRAGISNSDTDGDGDIDFDDEPLPYLNHNSMSINGSFLVCDINDLPDELRLSPSCVASYDNVLDYYQWFGYSINYSKFSQFGRETEQLRVKDLFEYLVVNNKETNELNNDVYRFNRRAYFTDPYCGSSKFISSEWFTIYNLNSLQFRSGEIDKEDVCYDDDVTTSDPISITANDAKIYRSGGLIPDEFGVDFTDNNVCFRLHDPRPTVADPTGDGQDFGPEICINFNEQLVNYLQEDTIAQILGHDFSFSFNNINPEDPNTPLFIPEVGELTYFPIQIHVTGNYGNRNGCNLDLLFDLTEIGFRSAAVAGEISYNCDLRKVESLDDGYTIDGYRWEYRPDPNVDSYVTIPSSPITNELDPLPDFTTLPTPLIIRRVSHIPDDENNYDCISEDPTDEITIFPPPLPPTVVVTQATCSTNSLVEFTGLPSNSWTITAINSDGTSIEYNGSSNTFSISDLDAGTYTFTVTDNSSNCTSDETLEIIIDEAPEQPALLDVTVSCDNDLGVFEVTNPLGVEYEYTIDGANYQSSPIFTNLINGVYTLSVRNISFVDCISNLTVTANCSCDNPPTLQLGSASSIICGIDPITVSNNIFGGSATNVTITHNGSGSINPSSTTNANFDFTYTPTTNDIGNMIIITVETDNPNGTPCEASIATYELTVNPSVEAHVREINQPCFNGTGSVEFINLPSNGWTITTNPTGDIVTGSSSSTIINNLVGGTYSFIIENNVGCTLTTNNIVINAALTAPTIEITQPTCSDNAAISISNLPSGSWDIEMAHLGARTHFYNVTNELIVPGTISQGSYTFTITNSSGCSIVLEGVINNLTLITPSFNLPSTICGSMSLPILNTTSDNGIVGTWNPAVVDSSITEYIFTPNSGQCAENYIYNVIFESECEPLLLTWGSDVSCQSADFNEKPDTDIVDGDCIRICNESVIDYNISGFTDNISNTSWNVVGGTTSNETNSSCTISWDNSETAFLNVTITLTDGSLVYINRCIEKVEAPIASFGILPKVDEEAFYVCVENPISFENLTITNNGHDDIYYNWDFGDGTTSNEFEPTHTFLETGVFKVTLMVFNGCNCSDSITKKVFVDKSKINITCPSMVCEGERATYSVSDDLKECGLKWSAIGGKIIWENDEHTQVSIVWNNEEEIDHNGGFGYVTVSGGECFKCDTTVKIPIIQNIAHIVGDTTICQNDQAIFTLPQWATTEFDWELDANGTGAVLLTGGMQRNEIIIQTNKVGTISLSCNYYNTLLGCGGYTKNLKINVKPAIEFVNLEDICTGTDTTFNFQTLDGVPVNNITWNIFGPENFSGSGTPLVNFNIEGVYTILVSSNNYCTPNLPPIKVFNAPEEPIINEALDSICVSAPNVFTCDTPDNVTAFWAVEGGTILGSNIGSSVTVMFDVNYAQDYKLSLTYERAGCESNTEVTLILDEPNINFVQFDTSLCGSSSATYSVDPIDDIDYYNWTVNPENAGSVVSGQNTNQIEVLFNQPTTTLSDVEVILSVRKCGKVYEDKVENIEISPTATISNIQHDNTTCANQPFEVSFDVENGFTITQVIWNFGDGTPLVHNTNTFMQHTYQGPLTNSTTYTVAVMVKTVECNSSTTFSFDIEVAPTPGINVGTTTVNFHAISANSYNVVATLVGGFAATSNIVWHLVSTGAVVATGDTLTVTTNDVGNQYYAEITNSFGCSDTTEIVRVIDHDGGTGTGCDDGGVPPEIVAAYNLNSCTSVTLYPATFVGDSLAWDLSNIPDNANIVHNANNVNITNLLPGVYSIIATAYSGSCYREHEIQVTVPFKAGLKTQIACNGNNQYTVNLFDHSLYVVPYTHVYFTINNGATWLTSNLINGIEQRSFTLNANNTYLVGIKITDDFGYACEKIISLNLPSVPDAAFSSDTTVCMEDAVLFTPNQAFDADLQYHWSFGDGTFNTQYAPSRVYADEGYKIVTLTVTNQVGCSSQSTQSIRVNRKYLHGKLKPQEPKTDCVGGSVTIDYEPFSGYQDAYLFQWYKDNTDAIFETTTIPSLTVHENGQYFVYAQNEFGCWELNPADALGVGFTPPAQIPVITAPSSACLNSDITLSVPESDNLSYEWSLNGFSNPNWDGLTSITYTANNSGNLTFEVVAHTTGAVDCPSQPASAEVLVLDQLDTPIIKIASVNCESYKVELEVSNPQVNVNYYWSNGDFGQTATITHDGPIQVRAESQGCSVTSQIDLPIDLSSLAWSFPGGCYEYCKKELNEKDQVHIIGPLGNFNSWAWLENYHDVDTGAGQIDPFYYLSLNNSYQLLLDNKYCKTTFSNLEIIENKECENCKISVDLTPKRCIKINGEQIYVIEANFNNEMDGVVNVTLNLPNEEGYFASSSYTLEQGYNGFELYFFPNDNFVPYDSFLINVKGVFDKGVCFKEFRTDFPKCEDLRTSRTLKDKNIFVIKPNPAKDKVQIYYQVQAQGALSIQISDLLGIVYQTKALQTNQGKVELNLTNLIAGVYNVTILQNNKPIAFSKLIKN